MTKYWGDVKYSCYGSRPVGRRSWDRFVPGPTPVVVPSTRPPTTSSTSTLQS